MKRVIYRSLILFTTVSMFASCSKGGQEDATLSMMSVTDAVTEEPDQATIDRSVSESEDISVLDRSSSKNKVEVQPNFIPTQAASELNDEGLHKFIRTARLKFQVKEILIATSSIEDIILNNGGFIIQSTIENYEYYTVSIPISKDSVLIMHKSTPRANMVLRVPYQKLDTTLRQIAPLAFKVESRVVEAEDVTKQLLSDKLARERLAKKQQRIGNAINIRNGRLNDAMSAEEVLDYTQQQADEVKLSTYSINDQINYSTIYIDLSQSTLVYTEKVAKEKEISEYEYKPGFGTQAVEALANGWSALNVVILLVINIWPFLLLILIGGVVFMKLKKKRNRQ